jgi:SNF2 family DNA or RNA helicase
MTDVKQIPDDLYAYQKEDTLRLLAILQTDNGVLNLSEMGTGKTPIAMAISKLGNFKKTLVICPHTLRYEWSNQIKTWLGIDPTVSDRSPYSRLDNLAAEYAGEEPDNPFFIVNYETFRKEEHRLLLNIVDFDFVILDEAHKIRNHSTLQFRGLREFLDYHPKSKILAMTGSPIVNSPDDLYSILTLLRPSQFPARERFNWLDRYCYTIPRRTSVKVLAIRNKEGIKKEIDPFTVKRSKKEVLPFLPDKYFRKVLLDMQPPQREMYDKCLKELVIELQDGQKIFSGSTLALLTRLREINLDPMTVGKFGVPSAKTDFLLELIDEMGDQKLVVFSCFEEYISYLDTHLKDIPHITITGKTSPDHRVELANKFQNDDSIKLALGTIKVMGEGITLTAASNVILMDRWWAPSVNDQAVDRLHRIGQKDSVQVILPINKNSVDQSLDVVLDHKAKLIVGSFGGILPDVEESVIGQVLQDIRDGVSYG